MVRNITDVDDSILPRRASSRALSRLAAAETARSRANMAGSDAAAGRGAPGDRGRAADHRLRGPLLDKGNAYISAARCTSTCRRPRVREALALPRGPDDQASRGRGAATPRPTAARAPTSCCGSRRSATSPRGGHRSAPVGRAGTSVLCMALHEHGRRSTCTAAAPTSSSPTTSARSRRASRLTGEPLSRHWMHSAMVTTRARRCRSRSQPVFVSDLLKVADPARSRLALIRHHYRSRFRVVRPDLDEAVSPCCTVSLPPRASPTGPTRRRSPTCARCDRTAISTRRARSKHSTNLASAILSGAPTRARPKYLRELGMLLGVRPLPPARIHLTRGEMRPGAVAGLR